MADADVLVFCEAGKGQTESANARVIATGRELCARSGGRLAALVCGHGILARAEELCAYVEAMHALDDPGCEHYTGPQELQALLALTEELKPGTVLFGHTFIGMDLAARLAARLGVGLASNCVGLAPGEGASWLRPMYRGRIQARVAIESRPAIATLQLGGARLPAPKDKAKLVRLEPGSAAKGIRALRTIEPSLGGIDITKADIVVSGGRGVGTRENYALVSELAEALGGVPACSRPLVDMGWFGTSSQVGLSGNTVKPKLYVACGISGAIEHLHGMKESGVIVAINQDPGAPIFKVAHFGMVGDLNEIVPQLTAQVKAAKAKPGGS